MIKTIGSDSSLNNILNSKQGHLFCNPASVVICNRKCAEFVVLNEAKCKLAEHQRVLLLTHETKCFVYSL